MTTANPETIRIALQTLAGDADFAASAVALLETLGYRSERTLAGQSGDAADFIGRHHALNPGTQSEQDFLDAARSVRILFQLTDAEISASAQQSLFHDAGAGGGFDSGNARSFLFAAVALRGDDYPRSRYAAFTRELNKRIPIPVVVLFRAAGGRVTLALVRRRPNRHNPDRDVVGNVSLIREIDPAQPHRAHLDILSALALPERLRWMDSHGKPRNFDGLLDAWLDALDTEALNRRFYRDLFAWFERAIAIARFPTDQAVTLSPEEHTIRLITRLLFVWFLKEKGLVDGDLFVENRAAGLLKDYDRAAGDSYYRAVLQNLFFATLNTAIGDRRFSAQTRDDHRNFSVWRYRNELADPAGLTDRLARTPFVNGGLFDCLDSFDAAGRGGVRVDCFTDNPRHRAGHSVPNRLFFGDAAAPGIIDLFGRYQFTVEENTPTEQEVALDPELLGKVFENLLAAVNPETQQTARKETGSYYTPRPVVDYMADEALVAALAQQTGPEDGADSNDDSAGRQERLRYLLNYDDAFADAETLFTPAERDAVVRAIAGLKVLDPAVGSGAFPMGILHKLTLALRRLDPDNRIWERVQRELAAHRAGAAFGIDDPSDRDARLSEISAVFELYRDSDYGRKLYLIQNCIYGVDLQPIAAQIAKLRFFISLAIEQQPGGAAGDNYGIKPLPNLETRFVAADTLRALERPAQMSLGQTDAVRRLEGAIAANRERHFHAVTRAAKLQCRQDDAQLCRRLAQELATAGFPAASARQIAAWDPFDQNGRAADWFDAKHMFQVSDGFDIVIGNPPYAQVRKGIYSASQFPYAEGRDKGKQNLYKLFVEQSYNLCSAGGVATLIVQSSLMCDLSSSATRLLLLERTRLQHVIEFPERARSRDAQVFSSVTQSTCIYQFVKALPDGQPIRISVANDTQTISNLSFATITGDSIATLWPSLRPFPHIKEGSVSILEKIAGCDSIRPLLDYVADIAQGDLNLTTHSKQFSTNPSSVMLLRGRNVSRFVIAYNTTEYCVPGFRPEKVASNQQDTFLISQHVMNSQAPRRLNFAMTTKSSRQFLWGNSVDKTKLRNQAHSKAFLALLNSKFMDWFFRITSSNNNVQGYQLEQLPIPDLTASDRRRLGRLADRVLKAKAADPAADTSEQEAEIDRLVYALYGLTDAEIAVVEGR